MMKRSIRRSLRWSLVVTLATFLSSGPAAAGWLHRHMHACPPEPNCSPVPTCCAPVPVPVCCTEPVYVPSADNCCQPEPCCGGEVVDGMSVLHDGSVMGGTVLENYENQPSMDEHHSSDAHQDADTEKSPPADKDAHNATATAAAANHDDAAATDDDSAAVAPPAPATEPESIPATQPKADSEATTDDLFGGDDEPKMGLPADSQPATPKPATPKPVTPKPVTPKPVTPKPVTPEPTAPPADATADDLFGGAAEPATTEPAPKPVAPAESESMDDLFGAPADELSAPADLAPAPAETPATGGVDDLFGDDAGFGGTEPAMPAGDAQTAEDIFGAPADAPANGPSGSSESIDDLFGDPAVEPDAGQPATPQTPAEGTDDLFNEPPAENTDGGALDDLFSNWNGDSDAAQDAAAVETAQATESVDTLTGLDNTELRTWVDNTGGFRTEGRLIKIGGDFVRLRKDNGKTCTVPISRLSEEDSEYVQSISQRVALFVMAASSR